ncbi:MAG: Crp/Fnr family transcriptional regulator, partial [Campylobacteraceae bacterium]
MTNEDVKNLDVFLTLKKDEIYLLLNISTIENFNKNQIIHYENDPINNVYFLLHGKVKAYKVDRFDNEVFLYSLKKPALVSTFFLTPANKYFANIECLEDATILSTDINKLQELIKENPNIMMFFYNQLSEKTKIFQYLINRETVFDGTSKVAYMLVNSLEEFNTLKKQEVAYMLNIQPETLS